MNLITARLGAAVLIGAVLPASAHDDGLTCHDHPGGGSTYGGGRATYLKYELKNVNGPVVYRGGSGELTIGRADTSAALGDGSVKFITDSISVGLYRGDGLRGADLDGDGRLEAIVSSRTENALVVVWGEKELDAPRRMTRLPIGPGPAGIEPVDRGRPDGGEDLVVPLTATDSPRLALLSGATLEELGSVPLDPVVGRAKLFATASVPPVGAGSNWILVAASQAHSASCSAAEPPIAEILTVDADAAGAGIPGMRKFSNVTLKRGVMSAIGGHFTGRDVAPWFILMNEEDPIVEVVNAQGTETMLFTLGDRIGSITLVGYEDHDAVAITFHGGAHAGLYEFDPVDGFKLVRAIDPPDGRRLFSVGPLGDGGIAALDGPVGSSAPDGFSVMRDTGSEFESVGSGLLPIWKPFASTPAVKLFTGDPFGGGGFEFQSFASGDWARDAVFDGTKIDATIESYLGETSGLGNAMAAQFVPVGDPGAAAVALGNQWGDEGSSLFFTGAPQADGDAAVAISPPPGAYSNPIAVSLNAAPGTQIVFRIGGGSWQGYSGPVIVASDSTIDYYGQAADGSLSGIASASFEIDQALWSDTNHDGVPDLIASALGLDLVGDGDSDDDGISDIEELVNGSDPKNPQSLPDELLHRYPPELTFRVNVMHPSIGDGPDVPPPAGTPVELLDLDGSVVATARTDATGLAEVTIVAAPPVTGSGDDGSVDARDFNIWHSNKFTTRAQLSLMQLSFRALPDPDPDLPLAMVVEKWIADVIAALPEIVSVAGFRTGKFAQSDYSFELPIDPDTTLSSLAFAAWASMRLEAIGISKPQFPWDSRRRRGATFADLALLEVPSGPGLVAHDVAHVLQQEFIEPLTRDPGFAPLRAMGREIMRAGAAAMSDLPLPLSVLANVIEERRMHDRYASAVSSPVEILLGLRDQWLGEPQPRPIIDVEGTLVLGPEGRWMVETVGGTQYEAVGAVKTVNVGDGGAVVVEPRPFRFPFGQGILPGSTVRLVGFPLVLANPLVARVGEGADPVEVVTIEFVDADVSNPSDGDGDGLDDSFELLLFGGLQQGFWTDFDGDGFADGEERMAGTDPTDGGDFPPGSPALPAEVEMAIAGDGAVVLTWLGSSAAVYHVDKGTTTEALELSPVDPTEIEPGIFQWVDPSGGAAGRQFYRVGVTIPSP